MRPLGRIGVDDFDLSKKRYFRGCGIGLFAFEELDNISLVDLGNNCGTFFGRNTIERGT